MTEREKLVETFNAAYKWGGLTHALDVALEEAAGIAALFPAVSHGDLATDPHAAAAQAAQEIAAAILAMKEKK